jgi:hypothetical protein
MTEVAAITRNLTQEGAKAPSLPIIAETLENAPRLNSKALPNFALPHIVSEWAKNGRESVRITLSEYQGRAIIDCRQWYVDKSGELKPSPKGLSLAMAHLPALASGLAAALDLARCHGLVQEGGVE